MTSVPQNSEEWLASRNGLQVKSKNTHLNEVSKRFSSSFVLL